MSDTAEAFAAMTMEPEDDDIVSQIHENLATAKRSERLGLQDLDTPTPKIKTAAVDPSTPQETPIPEPVVPPVDDGEEEKLRKQFEQDPTDANGEALEQFLIRRGKMKPGEPLRVKEKEKPLTDEEYEAWLAEEERLNTAHEQPIIDALLDKGLSIGQRESKNIEDRRGDPEYTISNMLDDLAEKVSKMNPVDREAHKENAERGLLRLQRKSLPGLIQDEVENTDFDFKNGSGQDMINRAWELNKSEEMRQEIVDAVNNDYWKAGLKLPWKE